MSGGTTHVRWYNPCQGKQNPHLYRHEDDISEDWSWNILIFHVIFSDLHQHLVTVNVITIYDGPKLILHDTIIACIRLYLHI